MPPARPLLTLHAHLRRRSGGARVRRIRAAPRPWKFWQLRCPSPEPGSHRLTMAVAGEVVYPGVPNHRITGAPGHFQTVAVRFGFPVSGHSPKLLKSRFDFAPGIFK